MHVSKKKKMTLCLNSSRKDVPTMLHEAVATVMLTNEKHCNLRLACYTQQLAKLQKVEDSSTFLATCNASIYCIASCENGVLRGRTQLFQRLQTFAFFFFHFNQFDQTSLDKPKINLTLKPDIFAWTLNYLWMSEALILSI